MSAAALLAHFDRQMCREAAPDDAGLVIERGARITRAHGPGSAPEDNCILWSDLDASTADAVIAGERARAETHTNM